MQHDFAQVAVGRTRVFTWPDKIGTECARGNSLWPVLDQAILPATSNTAVTVNKVAA